MKSCLECCLSRGIVLFCFRGLWIVCLFVGLMKGLCGDCHVDECVEIGVALYKISLHSEVFLKVAVDRCCGKRSIGLLRLVWAIFSSEDIAINAFSFEDFVKCLMEGTSCDLGMCFLWLLIVGIAMLSMNVLEAMLCLF